MPSDSAAAKRELFTGLISALASVALAGMLRQSVVPSFEARKPVVVLLVLAAIGSCVRALRPSATSRRISEFMRALALVCWISSWPAGPPWAVAGIGAVAGGLLTWRSTGSRPLAAVALGGAIAVGWNAWRFGPPPERVFLVASCAVVAAAVFRGIGISPRRDEKQQPSTSQPDRARRSVRTRSSTGTSAGGIG